MAEKPRWVSGILLATSFLFVLACGASVGAQDQSRPTANPTVKPFHGLIRYRRVGPLSGHLNVVGSDEMAPLMKLWIDGFTKIYPQVKFEMEAKSSLAVSPALTSGAAQLGPLGRKFLQSEESVFTEKHGYKPLSIPVAGGCALCIGKSHEVVFFVNKDNPLDKIDYEQLREVFAEGGAVTSWGQLGLKGDWADKPIHLWRLIKEDGITHLLEDEVFGGREFKQTVREKAKVPNLPALDAIMQEVAADRYALGFSGWAYATKGVKALALAKTKGGPYYKGTFEEVVNHTYPLSRVVYIHIDRPPGQALDPKIREFLRYALSKEGQEAVLRQNSYLPLPPRFVRESLRMLE